MQCPHCQAEAHPGECLSHWRDQVQQRVDAYRARRGDHRPHRPIPGRVIEFRRGTPDPADIPTSAPLRGVPRPSNAAAALPPPVSRHVPIEPLADPVDPPPVAYARAAEVAPPGWCSSPAPALRQPLPEPVLEDLPPLPPPPPEFDLADPVGTVALARPATAPEIVPGRRGARLEISLPVAAAPASAAPTAAAWDRRLHSALLDAVVVGAAALLFALAGWASIGFVPPDAHTLRHLLAAFAVVPMVLAAVYFFISFSSGVATWGMRQAGLEIRAFDGPLTPAMLQRRSWACLVSLLALGMGYFWMYCDPQRLTWHDYISRTYVAEVDAPEAQ